MSEIGNIDGGLPEKANRAPSEQVCAIMQVSLTEEQIWSAHVAEVAPLVGPNPLMMTNNTSSECKNIRENTDVEMIHR